MNYEETTMDSKKIAEHYKEEKCYNQKTKIQYTYKIHIPSYPLETSSFPLENSAYQLKNSSYPQVNSVYPDEV